VNYCILFTKTCLGLTHNIKQRFFERIARTYRREHWGAMLQSILSMWCDCARQSGDVDATVPLLLEMIGSSKFPLPYTRDAVDVCFCRKCFGRGEDISGGGSDRNPKGAPRRSKIKKKKKAAHLFSQSTSPSKLIDTGLSDASPFCAPP